MGKDAVPGAASSGRIEAVNRRALVALALVVLLPAAVYAGDLLVLRYRIARGDGLETLRVYLATPLKSGKTAVFTDRQETEVCARSLFPHFGYRPCWYARRSGSVKVL